MGKKKRTRTKKKNPHKLWELFLKVLEKALIAAVSRVLSDLLTELLFKSK